MFRLCGQRVKMGHYKWIVEIVSTPFETSRFLHQGRFEKVSIVVSILAAALHIVSANISLEIFNL